MYLDDFPAFNNRANEEVEKFKNVLDHSELEDYIEKMGYGPMLIDQENYIYNFLDLYFSVKLNVVRKGSGVRGVILVHEVDDFFNDTGKLILEFNLYSSSNSFDFWNKIIDVLVESIPYEGEMIIYPKKKKIKNMIVEQNRIPVIVEFSNGNSQFLLPRSVRILKNEKSIRFDPALVDLTKQIYNYSEIDLIKTVSGDIIYKAEKS